MAKLDLICMGPVKKKNRGVLDINHNYFGEALFAKHGEDKKTYNQ